MTVTAVLDLVVKAVARAVISATRAARARGAGCSGPAVLDNARAATDLDTVAAGKAAGEMAGTKRAADLSAFESSSAFEGMKELEEIQVVALAC